MNILVGAQRCMWNGFDEGMAKWSKIVSVLKKKLWRKDRLKNLCDCGKYGVSFFFNILPHPPKKRNSKPAALPPTNKQNLLPILLQK